MSTTEAQKRGRGRPALSWLTYREALSLPTNTPILIDQGLHEARLVGRAVRGEVLTVRTRVGDLVELPEDRFRRARLVDGLYEEGDPVLLRGVPESQWRGGVVRLAAPTEPRVLVELISGFVWVEESQLEHADDRERREGALRAMKRGPMANDPIIEAINQEVFDRSEAKRRAPALEDGWAE